MMSDAKVNNLLELAIIALLVGDLLLMWKLVYGRYPWESSA